MRRPRRNHSAAFKAKVALAAIEGNATLAEGRSSRPPAWLQKSEWSGDRTRFRKLADSLGVDFFGVGRASLRRLRDLRARQRCSRRRVVRAGDASAHAVAAQM